MPDATAAWTSSTSWAATRAEGTLARLAETIAGIPQVHLRDMEPFTGPGPVARPSSAEMPDPADRMGRLQLLGEVARGGMGAIIKGHDSDLGRDLAIKVLLEQHRENPDLVRRFVEEAQISGQLQHPGVVPVYELGTLVDQRPYFAMKLVKGRTLAALLAERAGPAEDQRRVLGIFEQVCLTMAYAHVRGVIHRDLKPSNIMVGSFGEVQVMDWGLAKVLPQGGVADDKEAGLIPHDTVIQTGRTGADADLSQAGSIMGTPAYMPPEQASGDIDRLDERADVFALGSILCEILTGRPAFTGRTVGEIQRKAARGDLTDAFALLDACGADADLAGLARECLACELEDRPRNAGVVTERLAAYLAGVQERLRTAELARVEAQARAEEEAKRRILAEALAQKAQAHAVEEGRRRRLQVGLAASVLALSTMGGMAFTAYLHQRQARAAQVELALSETTLLRDQALKSRDDPRALAGGAGGDQACGGGPGRSRQRRGPAAACRPARRGRKRHRGRAPRQRVAGCTRRDPQWTSGCQARRNGRSLCGGLPAGRDRRRPPDPGRGRRPARCPTRRGGAQGVALSRYLVARSPKRRATGRAMAAPSRRGPLCRLRRISQPPPCARRTSRHPKAGHAPAGPVTGSESR